MGTRKWRIGTLDQPLRGADNWLSPIPTVASLPAAGVNDGDSITVYADPISTNNGLWFRKSGQWEFAPGGSGGLQPAYQRIVVSGSSDAVGPILNSLPPDGGTLFLQTGTHIIDTQMLRGDVSNIRIIGEGPATKLVIVGTGSSTFIQFGVAANIANLELVNLTIQVSPTASNPNTVVSVGHPTNNAIQVKRVLLENVQFSGAIKEALYINAEDVNVVNCKMTSTLAGASFARFGPNAKNVCLRDNRGEGIEVFTSGDLAADELYLLDNVWVSPAPNPATPYFAKNLGANNIHIKGNTLVVDPTGTVAEEAIKLVDGSDPGFVEISENLITAPYAIRVEVSLTDNMVFIEKNKFRNALKAVALLGSQANNIGFQVNGNSVFSLPGVDNLIRVRCPYAGVSDNSIFSTGQVGILVQSHYNVVSGNKYFNSVGLSTAASVAVDPEVVGFFLNSNSIVNNVYNKDILDNGNGTTMANNTFVQP